MATRKKTIRHGDIVKEVLADRGGNNSRKKSPPSFVKLDGLSQSAKDKLMNNRTVKPPKNINLVEGDPLESMESESKSRQLKTFPNDHILSAKIKEVNGMDYSNYFIEQHYRNCNSRSISPENSEDDSTNSSSTTNESVRSISQELEEACASNISGSTNVDIENGLPDDPSDPNDQEDNNSDYNLIRNSRYSKNAAIIGLIKNKIISLNDLELNNENAKSLDSVVDDLADLNYSLDEEDNEKIDKGDINCGKKFDKIPEYPHLVPHPEDSDFYAHPLQAYGKLDDNDIDFRLPRIGERTTTTSRQYFIREGLNDDQFTFKKSAIAKDAPKPKFNVNNLPKIKSPARSLRNDVHHSNKNSDNSYDSLINDENDGFRLNHNEFPTLQR